LSPAKALRLREERNPKLTPEQLIAKLKKLPPHEHENIPARNVEIYE
jgi:hypothetical protein